MAGKKVRKFKAFKGAEIGERNQNKYAPPMEKMDENKADKTLALLKGKANTRTRVRGRG